MATVVGIIFSNIHDRSIPELTKIRTMASVPFGSRYRLIDFTLSNMVNAGLTHVGVITNYNYQSLIGHVGSGKSWDLARRAGGVDILPPYVTAFGSPQSFVHSTRLEALKNISDYISDCTEDYVIISDCDIVCNLDLAKMIDEHIESRADITMMIKRTYLVGSSAGDTTIVESDENGCVTAISEYVGKDGGYKDVCTSVMVMKRTLLESILLESSARNYSSFTNDVLPSYIAGRRVRAFRHEGYFAIINSMQSYYMCNMDLLNEDVRHEVFTADGRPILTKIKNSPPTVYAAGANVKNSLIADGCVLNGSVENSILFRGVRIGKNSHVKNCILMQDTIVGDNVTLDSVITDKNAVIRDGRNLAGHSTLPFFVGKFVQV